MLVEARFLLLRFSLCFFHSCDKEQHRRTPGLLIVTRSSSLSICNFFFLDNSHTRTQELPPVPLLLSTKPARLPWLGQEAHRDPPPHTQPSESPMASDCFTVLTLLYFKTIRCTTSNMGYEYTGVKQSQYALLFFEKKVG